MSFEHWKRFIEAQSICLTGQVLKAQIQTTVMGDETERTQMPESDYEFHIPQQIFELKSVKVADSNGRKRLGEKVQAELSKEAQ